MFFPHRTARRMKWAEIEKAFRISSHHVSYHSESPRSVPGTLDSNQLHVKSVGSKRDAEDVRLQGLNTALAGPVQFSDPHCATYASMQIRSLV